MLVASDVAKLEGKIVGVVKSGKRGLFVYITPAEALKMVEDFLGKKFTFKSVYGEDSEVFAVCDEVYLSLDRFKGFRFKSAVAKMFGRNFRLVIFLNEGVFKLYALELKENYLGELFVNGDKYNGISLNFGVRDNDDLMRVLESLPFRLFSIIYGAEFGDASVNGGSA